MNVDFARAMRAALAYRGLGLVPLPSRSDDKRPALLSYHEFRAVEPPDSMYLPQNWQSTNIQVMTGVNTPTRLKILVVDVDGQEAIDTWGRICSSRVTPEGPWISASPSGGVHFYFAIPDRWGPVATRMIWGLWDTWGRDGKSGGWYPHKEIKILGEGSLVVAPPSFHVVHGSRRYRFKKGSSPVDRPRPDDAPEWLLRMPVARARNDAPMVADPPRAERAIGNEGLDAIQDGMSPHQKVSIAEGWGLRMAGRNGDGWIHCYRVGAEDNTPSAGFHAPTGRYKDHVTGEVLTFFQLGVRLDRFPSIARCAEWCSWQSIQKALAHS